ncbi:methyl coenzyme M reductase system, component A2 [Burkholderiales bacterium]|nr:methyl coenzyme M reductase system, component A2 [Burkholderiales bacterium]
MTAPVLEIAGLTIGLPRGSDRAHAVAGVNLNVAPNEIVCLVGESGSGKSVIAHATMGLLPRALAVTAGSIRLAGEELVGAPEKRLEELRCTRMAMIFQEPMTALNPVMRCGEQVDEVLRRHTKLDAAARRARVLDALADVRLPEPQRMASSYPHQLSGGQRQRIMIAMALALDPKLLIADEPTTALDVTTQAQILALVRELMREHGTGVLFITHDFGVVAEIADRVAVLKHGELVEVGPAAGVLRAPKHDYTKMLIASVPSMTPRHRAVVEGPTLVETRELAKTYVQGGWLGRRRDVQAAQDVDLAIRRGETLGIVGESGSGKSTVARCIARLVDPTGGSVVVDGLEVAGLPRRRLRELRRKVQVVFQDPYRSLNPRRTVGESIVEGPMNFGVSHAEATARARSLMELVRLDPASLDRYPHEFSGGQRQRICIARALAMEPKLLVADEPVSALDVSVQAQVLALLDEIRERLHLTMLFITHDLRVAAQVCDRIAVMHRGRVVELGPVAEVFARPKHEYTRSLLAAAPGRGM